MAGAGRRASGANFLVTAERCPQVLCRLIGLVAQQDRLTSRVDAIDTGRILRITIHVSGLGERGAAIIAEKMRQSVNVRTVRQRWLPPAAICPSRISARASVSS
jgi:hypothetical protein